MDSEAIATYVIKFIAGMAGILGIVIIFSSLNSNQLESGLFEIIFILSFMLIGVILVLISYDVIRKFSLKSIQTLFGLIAFIIGGALIQFVSDTFSEYKLILIILTLMITILGYEFFIHFIIKKCNVKKIIRTNITPMLQMRTLFIDFLT